MGTNPLLLFRPQLNKVDRIGLSPNLLMLPITLSIRRVASSAARTRMRRRSTTPTARPRTSVDAPVDAPAAITTPAPAIAVESVR